MKIDELDEPRDSIGERLRNSSSPSVRIPAAVPSISRATTEGPANLAVDPEDLRSKGGSGAPGLGPLYSPYASPPPSPANMQNPPLNPLVQPRGLPIVVPEGLQAASIPPNLPSFRGTRDEDPFVHVERFIELLTTCLITDNRYYLVWFPTTLKESAYEWYRNHAAATFQNWDGLMRAFLEQYRPEVGQSSALTTLASFRQGKGEDIISYIRRFEQVVTRFVGDLLTDDTLRHFFLQGFYHEKTIREIL